METLLEQKYAFNQAYLTAIRESGVYIPYLHFQKGYELAKEVYTNPAEIENLINEALDYEIYDLNNKEDEELKSYIDRMQSDGFIFALFEELHARANQFLIKAKIQKELSGFSYQSDGLSLWLEEESKEELKTELNEIENKLKKVNLKAFKEYLVELLGDKKDKLQEKELKKLSDIRLKELRKMKHNEQIRKANENGLFSYEELAS